MKSRIIISLFSFLLILSGCSVYNPHLIDIPLMQEKKDLRVDAGISILVPSVRSSISYGLTDNVAMQFFGSFGSDYRYYFQGSTGIYKRRNDRYVQELYGGFGYGYGCAYDGAKPATLDGKYQLYFAQYNLGKIADQKSGAEFGFSIKTGILHSNLLDNNFHELNNSIVEFESNSILLEPSVMARFGKGKLKFTINLSASYLIKINPIDRHTNTDPLNFGFGLNYRL